MLFYVKSKSQPQHFELIDRVSLPFLKFFIEHIQLDHYKISIPGPYDGIHDVFGGSVFVHYHPR